MKCRLQEGAKHSACHLQRQHQVAGADRIQKQGRKQTAALIIYALCIDNNIAVKRDQHR